MIKLNFVGCFSLYVHINVCKFKFLPQQIPDNHECYLRLIRLRIIVQLFHGTRKKMDKLIKRFHTVFIRLSVVINNNNTKKIRAVYHRPPPFGFRILLKETKFHFFLFCANISAPLVHLISVGLVGGC